MTPPQAQPPPGPLQGVVAWLVAHAGFPGRRLPARAETILCMAAAAEFDNASAARVNTLRGASSYDRAALRAHVLNRSHAHFKSDNSAKV